MAPAGCRNPGRTPEEARLPKPELDDLVRQREEAAKLPGIAGPGILLVMAPRFDRR